MKGDEKEMIIIKLQLATSISFCDLYEMLATYAEGVFISSRSAPKCSPLPSELLGHIFRLYLQLSTPYNPGEGRNLGQRCFPEHLLLVCKAWHDAATADSSLWREIILDPEIASVTPYKSLYSYTKVRSIRSRTQLLHVSINNGRGQVKRLAYLQAYYYLATTMSRWERLFYYLELPDFDSCITIHHLTAYTPNLREVVIWSSMGLGGISEILPKAPKLTSLEIYIPCIGPLPPSFCNAVTIASIQTTHVGAWTYILSQLNCIHTLILQPVHFMMSFPTRGFMRPSFRDLEMSSVRSLILVGPLDLLQYRLGGIKLPALQTLEVDLSPSGVEKQWSKTGARVREQLKGLFIAGLQKVVLNSIWFDQSKDLVDILQDTKGRVGKLVCFDVTCTLQCGGEREVEIDLGATMMQQGVVSSASALSMLDGLLKEHGIELSDLMVR